MKEIFFVLQKFFVLVLGKLFFFYLISKNLTALVFYYQGKYYKMEICLGKSLDIFQLWRGILNAAQTTKFMQVN